MFWVLVAFALSLTLVAAVTLRMLSKELKQRQLNEDL